MIAEIDLVFFVEVAGFEVLRLPEFNIFGVGIAIFAGLNCEAVFGLLDLLQEIYFPGRQLVLLGPDFAKQFFHVFLLFSDGQVG